MRRESPRALFTAFLPTRSNCIWKRLKSRKCGSGWKRRRGDEEGLRRLERYGIRFTCNIEVAARVVRWLAAALPEWEEPDGELRRAAAEQIITGIAEKLVEG